MFCTVFRKIGQLTWNRRLHYKPVLDPCKKNYLMFFFLVVFQLPAAVMATHSASSSSDRQVAASLQEFLETEAGWWSDRRLDRGSHAHTARWATGDLQCLDRDWEVQMFFCCVCLLWCVCCVVFVVLFVCCVCLFICWSFGYGSLKVCLLTGW